MESMKHQILAGAGLVAVIAFCGYMVSQLGAHQRDAQGVVATQARTTR